MVSSVSAPYSYYNVLNPDKPLNPPGYGQTTQANKDSPTPTGVSGANTGVPQISSDVLGLLQTFTPENALGQTVGLLGGAGDALTGSSELNILGNSFVKLVQDAYKIAGNLAKQTAATPNPIQAAINSNNAASNAYNQVLIKNAKAAVAANNGVIA